MKKSQRPFVVFFSLAGALSLTAVLLLAMQPDRLVPELSAVQPANGMDRIFQTQSPARPGQWKRIYVHHSRTPGGNAITLGRDNGGLGDHFVIGNGDGCPDGEIQMGQRWYKQQPAAPPVGASSIEPEFISICLVGDFDHTVPTPLQMQRLRQLVIALQDNYHITQSQVRLYEAANTPTGIGRYFPLQPFRESIQP